MEEDDFRDFKDKLSELSSQDVDKPSLAPLVVLELFKWGGVIVLGVLAIVYGWDWFK